MQQDKPQLDYTIDRIDPPGEARFTTLLNNVGNGMMLGAAPMFAKNLYDHVRGITIDKALEKQRGRVGLMMAGGGAVLGAVLGQVEGRRLQAYRNSMSDQLALQDEHIKQTQSALHATQLELKKWTDKEKARADKPADKGAAVSA